MINVCQWCVHLVPVHADGRVLHREGLFVRRVAYFWLFLASSGVGKHGPLGWRFDPMPIIKIKWIFVVHNCRCIKNVVFVVVFVCLLLLLVGRKTPIYLLLVVVFFWCFFVGVFVLVFDIVVVPKKGKKKLPHCTIYSFFSGAWWSRIRCKSYAWVWFGIKQLRDTLQWMVMGLRCLVVDI